MSIAQKEYAKNETAEHRMQRVRNYQEACAKRTPEEKKRIGEMISKATKGRIQSELERKHRSEAMKGRCITESHKLNLARSRSKYIYIINGTQFLSRKEATDFILGLNSNLNINTVIHYLQNKQFNLVDGEMIKSLEYILKHQDGE